MTKLTLTLTITDPHKNKRLL